MPLNQPICPICDSGDSKIISNKVFDAPEASIYQCQSCTIIFQHPLMPPEEESRFYESDFPGYMEGRAGTASWKSPEAHFARFARGEGIRRLKELSNYLRPDWDILEIGSSTGYFLELMRPYVRSVVGVEPGPDHAAYANQRGIRTVSSVEALDDDKQYNAIFIYYVLEHIREPIGFLESFKPLLKSEGKLFIEVPNVLDVLLSRYEIPQFGPFYWQRMHYYYYSPQTLTDLLSRAGYTSQLIPLQRYDLSNHMVWLRDGRPGRMGRFKDIFSLELETAYAETLKKHWLCDTILAIAQRPPT